jgi:hypothetical protein
VGQYWIRRKRAGPQPCGRSRPGKNWLIRPIQAGSDFATEGCNGATTVSTLLINNAAPGSGVLRTSSGV